MCNADKFVISQTFDNDFTITIKQQGSTLPMELSSGTVSRQVSFDVPYTLTTGTDEVLASEAVTQDILIIMKDPSISVSAITVSDTTLSSLNVTSMEGLVTALVANSTIMAKCDVMTVDEYTIRLKNKQTFGTSLTCSITGSGVAVVDTAVGWVGQPAIAASDTVNEEYTISASGISSLYTGTLFRQATAPTTGMSVGSVWVVSDGTTKVYDGSSWNLHNIDIWINAVNLTLVWKYDDHKEPYAVLTAFKALIDALNTGYITVVDANKLTVSKAAAFTLNSDDELTVTAITNYKEAVVGRRYIPAIAAVTPIAAVEGVSYTPSRYTPNNIADITISTTGLVNVSGTKTESVVFPIDVSVSNVVKLAGTSIPITGEILTFKTAYGIDTYWNSEPSNITADVSITYSSLADTFDAKLYKLSDNTVSAVPISVTKLTPLTAGKINLKITAADALAHLVYERGSKADRYYLKPTYRLAIDCNTLNNGNFIARIDNVYVDR